VAEEMRLKRNYIHVIDGPCGRSMGAVVMVALSEKIAVSDTVNIELRSPSKVLEPVYRELSPSVKIRDWKKRERKRRG
jgi:hypothetical protein